MRAAFKSILVLILVSFFGLTVSAADAPKAPAKAAKATAKTADQTSTDCTALLNALKTVAPTADETARFQNEVRVLELKQISDLDSTNGFARRTQIEGTQIWERMVFLLARGDWDEVLAQTRPVVYKTIDQAKKIMTLANRLAQVEKESAEPNAQEEAISKEFQAESRIFGQTYGTYELVIQTLQSVAAQNGVSNVKGLMKAGPDEMTQVMFDLKTERAVSAAKTALKILDDDGTKLWLPNAPVMGADSANPKPTLDVIQNIFRNNIYALLGRLEWGIQQQDLSQRPWLKVINWISEAYLNTTAFEFVPERWRKFVLTITGIAYDDLMLDRYLGAIQKIVSVSRFSKDGNVVISKDPSLLDLQIKTLQEYDAVAINNDLLITFARIAYHTDVWAQMMQAVAVKAGADDKSVSTQYANLLTRMKDAEKRAQTLGPLPYVYKPSTALHLRFATFQLAYLLATEQTVQAFVEPKWHNLMHILLPFLN